MVTLNAARVRERRSPLLALVLTAAIGGCGAFQLSRGPGPEQRLDRALAALERDEYAAAHEDLLWVSSNYPDRAIGRQALLVLVSSELDPRNPARRFEAAADLAARYLRVQDPSTWSRPLAEALYLLAIELGAPEQGADQSLLPRLPLESVPARLGALRHDRDVWSGRTDSLQLEVTRLQEQLAERDKELERIRKLLKS